MPPTASVRHAWPSSCRGNRGKPPGGHPPEQLQQQSLQLRRRQTIKLLGYRHRARKPENTRLGNPQNAVLPGVLPRLLVERLVAHPVPPAQISLRPPRLVLLQDSQDPSASEPAPPHRPLLLDGRNLSLAALIISGCSDGEHFSSDPVRAAGTTREKNRCNRLRKKPIVVWVVRCTGNGVPMRFPLSFVPERSWHVSPLRFGARREAGRRKHAGCDLYAPVGTPVFAVADGTIKAFSAFYLGTYAVTIDHGQFWVRYGEIDRTIAANLPVGSTVREGDQIGAVGDLEGLDLSMVHFEMYSGAATGPLTVPSRAPFMRRADLLDPTEYLDSWAASVISAAVKSSTKIPVPFLRLGSKGADVVAWQRRLLTIGYPMSLDGDFGPFTENATKQFQRDSDLAETGIVDPATYAEMIEAEKD